MRVRLVRFAAVLTLAAGAAPALAQSPPLAPPSPRLQPPPGIQQEMLNQARAAQLQAQIDAAARRSVTQQSDLFRLESQMRTQQNMVDLQALGVTPTVPPPVLGGSPSSLDVSGLASIPDSRLQDSNAKVKAAAENRP
jgi:hypothetical protein